MTITNLINLLDSVFTTSFKHTANILYSVSFETSNVNKTVDKIKELEINFTDNISTGKHVGAQITLDDIILVKESLNALILHYQLMLNIHSTPSRLKLHEMLKEIRENEKPDIKSVAKDVVTEILKPATTGKKLTKKQQLAEDVRKKSEERKFEIIKKLGKQGT